MRYPHFQIVAMLCLWAVHLSASQKAGFTLLTPERTGVTFTNSLTEEAGAANRVLFNGSGVAVGDFDQDGRPDVFFCSLNGRNTLYRNLGDWRFADVTEAAGLKRDERYYRGAVFADINGDRRADLLVAVIGGGVECFINTGGKFAGATATARTASSFASTTLALADVDGNGTLDLYVANNRAEDIRDRGQVDLQLVNGKMAVPPALQDRLVIINGEILEYGEPDQLFLNDGNGQFTPVSWTGGRFRTEAGGPLPEPPRDWGLTATFRDMNADGFPDLYVCNDFWTPDRIWINDGKGRFRALAPLALRNMCASSMGVDFADIDRDGDLDFFVVDMLSRDLRLRKRQKLAQPPQPSPIGAIEDRPQFMRNTLNLNRGDGTFAEIANYAGVAASEWSWSPIFLDVDLDGYEDLLITTGHAKDVQDLDAAEQIRARQHSWKGFKSEAERQKAFTKELMEHMRFYPRLDTPVVAFRNRGDTRFEDVTDSWGTTQPGIHHAIATADFDGDGDLDLVVNNLGSGAGLYRNDATAPRVTVRLTGTPPNTEAIGAKATLLGGPVEKQTLEVISGGRYMAGSEPLLVFAAGNSTNLALEVAWRSGRTSYHTNILPGRLHAIAEEPGRAVLGAPSSAPRPKLFENVTHVLKHKHHEDAFNDFERQPLLPRRLSQAGPGVSWFDSDDDGDEDLFVPSGRGSHLAYFQNDGRGGLQFSSNSVWGVFARQDQFTILGLASNRLVLATANHDNPIHPEFSGGALAAADWDGDGHLDLFVGGTAVPGRYPEATASRIFKKDSLSANINADLVNGALWSDLDEDGRPELVLACEWSAIKIFRHGAGQWHETTSSWGLDRFTGWWQGVTTGDFNGDGRMDIVAANWGLNSEYSASPERPLILHYGDSIGLLETEWDPTTQKLVPRRRLDVLSRGMPALLERFKTHKAYSEAGLTDLLGSDEKRAQKLSVTTLASMVFLNRGGRFDAIPLPPQAQFAPAFGVNVADFDGDGHEDIFLSQNFFATQPEMPRLDAGRSLLLRGDGTGNFKPMPASESGVEVYGEQRGSAVSDFDGDGRIDLAIAQNGASTCLFRNAGAKPGLRVRLRGHPGNPGAIGAVLRVKSGFGIGPAREIHAGSGYRSQDGAIQVLALPPLPAELQVRWPGGRTSSTPVPATDSILDVTPP